VAISQRFVAARNRVEKFRVEPEISESSQRALIRLEMFGRGSKLKEINKSKSHSGTASSHLVALHSAVV
jgi:hypothetical protein